MTVCTSILDLYDRVTSEVESMPAFQDMLFFVGSPDAEIMVVSEAPTVPRGPGDHTLYDTVTLGMAEKSPEEIAEFLRYYPFQDSGGNDLYREYVDRILEFCTQPSTEIGFTDLCKRPLSKFGDEESLNEVWD